MDGNDRGKEKAMSNNNPSRVLSRMGARELTPDETARISGNGATVATPTWTGALRHDSDFDQ